MILSVTLVPGPTPLLVDAYVVVAVPGGGFVSLQLGGTAVPGLVPLARGFTPFAVTGELLHYTVTGGEPPGSYAWLAGLVQTGTTTLVSPIAQEPFTLGP